MTLLAAAVVVAGAFAAFLVLRDAPPQLRVEGPPPFTVELAPGVERIAARDGELLRLRSRGATAAVRPLRLPPYRGDVAGMLPVYVTNAARRAGIVPLEEGKARIGGAPGYRVRFAGGTDTYLVPDEPGARDGVLLSLRGPAAPLRSALRSFEFR